VWATFALTDNKFQQNSIITHLPGVMLPEGRLQVAGRIASPKPGWYYPTSRSQFFCRPQDMPPSLHLNIRTRAVRTPIRTRIDIYIYTFIYTYMYIYIYICMYLHIYLRSQDMKLWCSKWVSRGMSLVYCDIITDVTSEYQGGCHLCTVTSTMTMP